MLEHPHGRSSHLFLHCRSELQSSNEHWASYLDMGRHQKGSLVPRSDAKMTFALCEDENLGKGRGFAFRSGQASACIFITCLPWTIPCKI